MDNQAKIVQLEILAKLDPRDALTHFLLGVEYLRAGRFPEAVAALTQTTETSPDHTAAWRMLGDAHRGAGDLIAASAAYTQAILVAERTGDLQVAKEARAFLKRIDQEPK